MTLRLRVAVPLTVSLAMLAGAAALTGARLSASRREVTADGERVVGRLLTQLREVLSADLAEEATAQAHRALVSAALDPQVTTLLLADERDRVLIANRLAWRERLAQEVAAYDPGRAAASRARVQLELVPSAGGDRLLGYASVATGVRPGDVRPTRLGCLFVEYDLAPQLALARRAAFGDAAWLSAVLVLIALGLAAGLHHGVTRKVERIGAAFAGLAAGDAAARCRMEGRGELDRLGAAFDALAGRLAAQQDVLREKNAELAASVSAARKEAERGKVLLELYEASLHLSERDLFGRALDAAVALTDSEIGFFHRISEDQRDVILSTWNARALETCTAAYDVHYPAATAGNWVDSLRQMRPVVYNSYPDSPNRRGLPEGHTPVRRFLSVPVVEDGVVRLIFGVGNKAEPYGDGDVVHVQLVANEMVKVIRQRRAEQALRELNADLERRVEDRTAQLKGAYAELESFSYSVSHDLRVPLRAIDGFSQLLLEDQRDRLDAEGQRLLGVVRESAVRMGRLIDDILAFSRTGRVELSRARVDMGALAREVSVELMAADAGRTVDLRLGALPPAQGDRALLRQVLANLLGNALKFTRGRAPAVVEVGGAEEGERCVYWVKDNGAGFDPRYAGKLFGVFQRLHRTEEFEGTGIGLAIVKRIVERHGGTIRGEGRVGEGATFRFELPRTEADHG